MNNRAAITPAQSGLLVFGYKWGNSEGDKQAERAERDKSAEPLVCFFFLSVFSSRAESLNLGGWNCAGVSDLSGCFVNSSDQEKRDVNDWDQAWRGRKGENWCLK